MIRPDTLLQGGQANFPQTDDAPTHSRYPSAFASATAPEREADLHQGCGRVWRSAATRPVMSSTESLIDIVDLEFQYNTERLRCASPARVQHCA